MVYDLAMHGPHCSDKRIPANDNSNLKSVQCCIGKSSNKNLSNATCEALLKSRKKINLTAIYIVYSLCISQEKLQKKQRFRFKILLIVITNYFLVF